MSSLPVQDSSLLLSDGRNNEDSFVVSVPQQGQALVQSIDIIAPIGNNPRLFGQTAACNALSDIYAMGGQAYTAMNILSFSSCDTPLDVVREILLGAMDKIEEAGAVACGGHTLESPELRFGLSVMGTVDKNHFAQNRNLHEKDILILTKPLGTGVLSTGIRGKWDHCLEAENVLYGYTTRLNRHCAEVIQQFKLEAATDITGFGLVGHALEMAKASEKSIILDHNTVPFMEFVTEYAKNGLIPKRCYDNKKFSEKYVHVSSEVSELAATLFHDPQTSGGLLLAVPQDKVRDVVNALHEKGDEAHCIGYVTSFLDNYITII